jgi:hypothetical protein
MDSDAIKELSADRRRQSAALEYGFAVDGGPRTVDCS